MADQFWVQTLGCPKNAVDSDKVQAALLRDGLEPAAGPEDAELVVVNTCAFVEAARRESIDTILALADLRRPGARLVVTGCLAERAGPELAAALPEVDAVVGFADEANLAAVAVDDPRRPPRGVRDLLELPRAAPSAPWAYVKVAEGCDRACRFCAIPSFRGRQRSRHPDAVVAECRALVGGGVAELVLVAQDVAWYGRDTDQPGALAPLLHRLDRELAPLGLRRLRLLYLYPSEVRGPLLDALLELPTAVPYFDLSLQHADRDLLARMARWGSGDRFLDLLEGIRARRPDAAFRSSFIVGFPGETEAAHDTLLAFLEAARLDWAGFHPFSAEAGTPAATMDRVVPDPVARASGSPSATTSSHRSRRGCATSCSATSSRCSSRAPTPRPATRGDAPTGRPPRSTAASSCAAPPPGPVSWCEPRPSRRSASILSPSPSRCWGEHPAADPRGASPPVR